MQYGRIYPLRHANLERNTATIDWQDAGSSYVTSPKQDKGLDPRYGGAALAQLFRGLSRSDYYVAFYVFEDSFSAFNAAKQMAVAAGLEYGWKPLESTEPPLRFGAVGTRPNAQ